MIGVVTDHAIINDVVYKNKFSNEGTVDGGYRLLRNIMGLWIIQCCKRQWDNETRLTWDEVAQMAEAAPAFQSFIDVNDPVFYDGDGMPEKIQAYCAKTRQKVPETKGEIARTVYESLAMSYRCVFGAEAQTVPHQCAAYRGRRLQNCFLNQLTANVLDREVVAGPSEATAIGNIMAQAKASGAVKDSAEMAEVIHLVWCGVACAPGYRAGDAGLRTLYAYHRITKGSDK